MNDKIETVLGGVLLLGLVCVGLPLVGAATVATALAIVLVAVKLMTVVAGVMGVVSFLTAEGVIVYVLLTILGGFTIAALGEL